MAKIVLGLLVLLSIACSEGGKHDKSFQENDTTVVEGNVAEAVDVDVQRVKDKPPVEISSEPEESAFMNLEPYQSYKSTTFGAFTAQSIGRSFDREYFGSANDDGVLLYTYGGGEFLQPIVLRKLDRNGKEIYRYGVKVFVMGRVEKLIVYEDSQSNIYLVGNYSYGVSGEKPYIEINGKKVYNDYRINFGNTRFGNNFIVKVNPTGRQVIYANALPGNEFSIESMRMDYNAISIVGQVTTELTEIDAFTGQVLRYERQVHFTPLDGYLELFALESASIVVDNFAYGFGVAEDQLKFKGGISIDPQQSSSGKAFILSKVSRIEYRPVFVKQVTTPWKLLEEEIIKRLADLNMDRYTKVTVEPCQVITSKDRICLLASVVGDMYSESSIKRNTRILQTMLFFDFDGNLLSVGSSLPGESKYEIVTGYYADENVNFIVYNEDKVLVLDEYAKNIVFSIDLNVKEAVRSQNQIYIIDWSKEILRLVF